MKGEGGGQGVVDGWKNVWIDHTMHSRVSNHLISILKVEFLNVISRNSSQIFYWKKIAPLFTLFYLLEMICCVLLSAGKFLFDVMYYNLNVLC